MTPQEIVDLITTSEKLQVWDHGVYFEIYEPSAQVVLKISERGGIATVGATLPVELGVLECNRILNEVSRRVDKMR